MPAAQSIPPKPISEVWRPDLTRLPEHGKKQQFYRRLIRGFVRGLVSLFMRVRVEGMEKFPLKGPALVAINHLGDADAILGVALWPVSTDAFAKMELYDLPILGWIIEKYGVIWVHRGLPDRRAISSALEGLKLGMIISIAPEGRESPTGSLEQGTEGAAYLAWKAGVPIIPVAITGTENDKLYGNMKRLKRTDVSMTVGDAFEFPQNWDRKTALEAGTQLIMTSLAGLLPEGLRGVYGEIDKI